MKQHLLFIILFIFTGMLAYCFYFEPNKLEVTPITLYDEQLKVIKIVFASDFHIKPHQQKRLEKVVNTINEQDADIVLSAGDYVSGHSEILTMPINKIAKGLGNIKSKYGFYTSLGNHDKYLGAERIRTALEEYNITVLNNENIKVNINGKDIYIVGIQYKHKNKKLINKALKGAKEPIILLTHSPDEFYKIPENVNLILAGHTHGGQVVLPFIGAILTGSIYRDRFLYGLKELDGKKIITTRGIGVSILPLRFNCPPEIMVIEFK